MSEQNLENKVSAVDAELEELVLRINRKTDEIIFSDPKTGKATKIKAKFIEEEEEPVFETRPPLTLDEFRDVLGRLNKLGISWSTDIPPTPVFHAGQKLDEEFWKEYGAVQREFPTFPFELNSAIFHAFLHPVSDQEIDKKAAALSDLLTQEYRSEFFFKYAIKVSYFEDIDWEVVVKAIRKRGRADAQNRLCSSFVNPA